MNKLSFETFLKKAHEVHGNLYDYSKSTYVSGHKKIVIICPKHGPFYQDPFSHLQGHICKECYKDSLKVKDHLGNEFPSQKAMCNHYGIDPNVFQARIKSSWSLEKALTLPLSHKFYTDLEGEIHTSLKSLSQKYHIPFPDIKETLVDNVMSIEKYNDLLSRKIFATIDGNVFYTKKDLCEYYNISQYRFTRLLNQGLDISVILSKLSQKVKDHLGNEFSSEKEMCSYHSISQGCFIKRKKEGLPLVDCLTPTNKKYSNPCKDHLGNSFPSERKMAKYHKIPYHIYKQRISRGWDLRKALSTPFTKQDYTVYDHLGNEYSSLKKMLKAYGVSHQTYKKYIQQGWMLKDILERKFADTTFYVSNTMYDTQATFLKSTGMSPGFFYKQVSKGLSPESIVAASSRILAGTSLPECIIRYYIGQVTVAIKLKSNFEIDCFLPEYNIAIEYDGSHWHKKKSQKDKKKDKALKKLGFFVVRFREKPLRALSTTDYTYLVSSREFYTLASELETFCKVFLHKDLDIDINRDIKDILEYKASDWDYKLNLCKNLVKSEKINYIPKSFRPFYCNMQNWFYINKRKYYNSKLTRSQMYLFSELLTLMNSFSKKNKYKILNTGKHFSNRR